MGRPSLVQPKGVTVTLAPPSRGGPLSRYLTCKAQSCRIFGGHHPPIHYRPKPKKISDQVPALRPCVSLLCCSSRGPRETCGANSSDPDLGNYPCSVADQHDTRIICGTLDKGRRILCIELSASDSLHSLS